MNCTIQLILLSHHILIAEFGLAEKHLGSSDLLAESPSKRESRPTAKKAAGEEAAAKRSPRSSSRSKRTRK